MAWGNARKVNMELRMTAVYHNMGKEGLDNYVVLEAGSNEAELRQDVHLV